MRQVGTVDKSAKAVTMKEVVGSIAVVATVFAGQQVRVVTEFLWKSRPGPCFPPSFQVSRGTACAPSFLVKRS